MEKLAIIIFSFFIVGSGLLCLTLVLVIYKLVRKAENKNADINLPQRNAVYLPSGTTFATWRDQLQSVNMMDLDERVIYRNLQKIVMGDLSLRYGDRFSLHYKVPLSIMVQERVEIVDGDLRQIIQQSVVDYVICVEDSKVKPAVALFVWNGSKAAFKTESVIPFSDMDRRTLFSADDVRSWSIAGVLEGAGISSYFLERNALEVLVSNQGEYVLIDRLAADLSNSIQGSSLLRVGG